VQSGSRNAPSGEGYPLRYPILCSAPGADSIPTACGILRPGRVVGHSSTSALSTVTAPGVSMNAYRPTISSREVMGPLGSSPAGNLCPKPGQMRPAIIGEGSSSGPRSGERELSATRKPRASNTGPPLIPPYSGASISRHGYLAKTLSRFSEKCCNTGPDAQTALQLHRIRKTLLKHFGRCLISLTPRVGIE